MNTCNSANSKSLGKLLKIYDLTPKNKQKVINVYNVELHLVIIFVKFAIYMMMIHLKINFIVKNVVYVG